MTHLIPTYDIAKKFEVTTNYITSIINYKKYLHVSRICQRYINRIKNDPKLLKEALNNSDLLIANQELVIELKKPLFTLEEYINKYPEKQIKKEPPISSADVRSIRSRLLNKESASKLALEYGVATTTIELIKNKNSWRSYHLVRYQGTI